MKKCFFCGKKGFTLALDKFGRCENCFKRLNQEAEEKDIERMKTAARKDQYNVPVFDDGSFAIPRYISGCEKYFSDFEKVKIDDPWSHNPNLLNYHPDLTVLQVGDMVTFKEEGTNLFDIGAIAVYARDQLIGYMKKNSYRDSVTRSLHDRRPIWSYISDIDQDEGVISLFIASYIPLYFKPAK